MRAIAPKAAVNVIIGIFPSLPASLNIKKTNNTPMPNRKTSDFMWAPLLKRKKFPSDVILPLNFNYASFNNKIF